MSAPPLLTIRCRTFNHVNFIRKCLDGFVMQQTTFPFVAIVHDDASTDGTADIVREYAEKYPDIIKPILQTENQYSKKDGSIGHILNAHTRGKYVALCEGDDYWTDPQKLQKQVDFMETHPEYSLVCSNATILSNGRELDWKRYDKSCDVPMKDVIVKRGSWIYTASMLYRSELMNDYPDYARECHVGDYPLSIHLALRGKVYFIAEKMVTYRFMTQGSWSSSTKVNEAYFDVLLSEFRMLQGYDRDSNGIYHKYIQRVIGKQAIMYLRHVPHMRKKVQEVLPDFPKWLDLGDRWKWWKLRLGIASSKHPRN